MKLNHLIEKTKDELVIEVAQLRYEKKNLLNELSDLLEKHDKIIENIEQILAETFCPQPILINILKELRK